MTKKEACGPIVLLTDFGLQDPFVGVMKGVILGLAPRARVVDLCHGIPPQDLRAAAHAVKDFTVLPAGDAGWDKAEVTLGGVSTDELSSRTLESRRVPGLHFIGEVVDVTGWLGGFNFQWAWSSGWVAGTAVAGRAVALRAGGGIGSAPVSG